MRIAFQGRAVDSQCMKRIKTAALLAAAFLAMEPLFAQTPQANESEKLNALIQEIQMQQTTIAENQAKLEEKLATLGETIRQARIYSSRGGR